MYKTFNDYLIKPKFSVVKSRKDVDLSTKLNDKFTLKFPVMSANMKSITEIKMANAMHNSGGIGVLHRFCSDEQNVDMFKKSPKETFVSIGIREEDRARARHLLESGAKMFCIDVAHGAQQAVVDQYTWLRKRTGDDAIIMVGNFATSESIEEFSHRVKCKQPDLFKIGIGPGSACETRVKTGVGVPQLSAIQDCSKMFKIVADGGLKTPGDIAKALGAGAVAVMVGGMLAGTEETSLKGYYAGSAYLEKPTYKASEGAKFEVPHRGSVEDVLNDIAGGLRSAFSYVGASNLKEFQQSVEFIKVSNSTILENTSHFAK